MDRVQRGAVIIATFLLVAAVGFAISYAAPFTMNDDDLVYLIGAQQVRDGNLPDPEMLAGYDYKSYVFPKLLLAWYEPLGYLGFKTISLVVLVVATGLAGYGMFRLAGLEWVPSLLLAVVLLMPREAAGTEVFGIFTFREAIGRAVAVPVFLLATGLLVRRLFDRKPVWPVFLGTGVLMLLHPTTVMGFAGVALASVAAVQLFRRERVLVVVRDTIVSGIAFVAGGAYFFAEVLARLSRSVSTEGVSSADYVAAVLFRNQWEFPAETILRFRHMAVVSLLLLIPLVFPLIRRYRGRDPFPHAREVTVFGIAMMVASLTVAISLPAINLCLMEHADWPYVFQQWSRASKFFYVGLFVALMPAASTLARWHRRSLTPLRHVVVALVFTAGLASSSFAFEVVQFAVGYPNYETAYIPQALSGAPDDLTAEDYRETCRVIESLGGGANPAVLSDDFAFRYYCAADLYTTEEEGSVYSMFPRPEMVRWHTMVLAQRAALESGDPVTIRDFARQVGARFIVLPRTTLYAAFEHAADHAAAASTRHIVVRVD